MHHLIEGKMIAPKYIFHLKFQSKNYLMEMLPITSYRLKQVKKKFRNHEKRLCLITG